MKKIIIGLIAISAIGANAQDDIQNILRAGVDDATRFSESSIAPAAEASIPVVHEDGGAWDPGHRHQLRLDSTAATRRSNTASGWPTPFTTDSRPFRP